MAVITMRMIKDLRERIGVGNGVANELLVLSGGDVDLAETCSRQADGLDQCKAAIIDARFRRLEDEHDAS
jgi:translation elongation factor EF-Ts